MTPIDSLPFSVLAVRGADARRFLNGQLSQDVLALRTDRVELAGLHNPQGRTLAILRLLADGPQDVLVVLPRELAADTETGLRRLVLRARVTIADDSARWRVRGLGPGAVSSTRVGDLVRSGESIVWCHTPDGRGLALTPVDAASVDSAPAPEALDEVSGLAAWRRADIAAGVPELTLATRGEFVAQMLNLDALDAISFTKGCYTGQEVIARAHYRGRVKRRLQGFETRESAPLLPGQSVTLGDGRRAAILTSAATPTGGQVFLAIAPWPPAAEADPAPSSTPADIRVVASTPLPLPYPLPE